MRWDKAWIIARKDLSEFRKNRIIIGSLVAMPLVFSVVLPLVFVVPIMSMPLTPETLNETGSPFPANITVEEAKKMYATIVMEYVMPFFLVIGAALPTILASYSFVGEKLNKSLEPLLAAPITDLELFAGKCAAVFVPTIMASFASFATFLVVINVALYPTTGSIALPGLKWLLAIIVLAPLMSIMSIEANVYISSRVKDVRAAEQLGGMVVMPIILLVIMLSASGIQMSGLLIPVLIVIVLIVDIGLFFLATRTFQREKILTEWK